ncbi:MAG: GNAT family N-acetyltransferase [Anaerolineae bacterium]|nr:GNAT family N-acetyltransferase [Anaerolineae bacterium]
MTESLIIARSYAGDEDMALIQQANARWAQMASSLGYIHPGDIAHRLGNGMRKAKMPLTETVQIWEKDGEVVGWVANYQYWHGFELQIHPDYRGSDLHNCMADWGEAQVKAYIENHPSAEPDAKKEIFWDLFEGDEATARLMKERGYKPGDKSFSYATRDLSEPFGHAALPEYFSIRQVTGPEEVEAIIAVHSGAFGSEWTAEQYLKVMEGPGYLAEREWVVVEPLDTFAAFTVTWFDEINKTGLFEPVGTHEKYQRAGLGRALMTHVMYHMRNQGLETAIVWHGNDNPASAGLYAALGFQRRYTIQEMKRELT